ncbi:multicopper oxidase family protein [Rhizobium chutanense]|uniref:Multicopper oxidase family protein n=1 Tax=Rhizobium chutanense TaxID=2035448 RepID=A0A3S0S1Z5_9HYPH|nr:multicopper oxidase family protein [Rhizobium chutanense]RUM06172.1 multicopper oxidase family protein [Rhizobium chutanense]
MHRRTFLTGIAGLAVTSSVTALVAIEKSNSAGNMNMAGMDMGDAGSPRAEGMPVLPEGQPLRELPRLANQSGEAGLFRTSLAAEPATLRFAEGLDTPVLLYNRGNPVIEAREGDRIEIDFTNGIPDQPTTVHWHGMPVPAEQDGNPMAPVAAGASQRFTFDLPQASAAPYWFHPHPHGHTAEQVYRGLAGIFLVKPKNDPIPAEYGDTILMLTDLRLAADGSIPENGMMDHMNGRVGDHVLVNGQKNPVLAVAKGEKRRLRLFNATNARFLRLSFENASMVLIGTDGGLLEAPLALDELLLAPAERVELVVAFDQPGSARLTTLDYERGWMGPGKPDEAGMSLFTVNVSDKPAPVMPVLPARLRQIAPLPTPVKTRRFVLTESMSGMSMAFQINGASFDMNRIDEVMKTGDVELWEIVNKADMDHPFHVHGTQFQIVEYEKDGKITKAPYRSWKDTVNVVSGQTVRFLIRQDMPGQRMYHCHILEHEDLGMMGLLEVRA